MSAHAVFVLSGTGKPLTPTTPAKARKLLKSGVAVKVWSKFGTFGIQLTTPSREETPEASIGVDNGAKFEGYSVVVGVENVINVNWRLPDKKKMMRKVEERRTLRRARRWRKCRRRPKRFDNRARRAWLAPSQGVVVGSRLKAMRELFRIFPIRLVGFEAVRFNHAKKRWGAHFSTAAIGKARLRDFWARAGALVFDFAGYETQAHRKRYGYRKTQVKSADKFTAHCADSLTLAIAVNGNTPITPGPFVVVDDTYRFVRRKLHDTQAARGGVRDSYSRGTVFGLRKGLIVGTAQGVIGQLCGETRGRYRIYRISDNKRASAKTLAWVSSAFRVAFRSYAPIPLSPRQSS